jgi:hypothetical protein
MNRSLTADLPVIVPACYEEGLLPQANLRVLQAFRPALILRNI